MQTQHVCVITYVYACTYAHVYILASIYVCMYVCMYTYEHTVLINAKICMHIRTYVRMHVCIYECTYTYMYIGTYSTYVLVLYYAVDFTQDTYLLNSSIGRNRCPLLRFLLDNTLLSNRPHNSLLHLLLLLGLGDRRNQG